MLNILYGRNRFVGDKFVLETTSVVSKLIHSECLESHRKSLHLRIKFYISLSFCFTGFYRKYIHLEDTSLVSYLYECEGSCLSMLIGFSNI